MIIFFETSEEHQKFCETSLGFNLLVEGERISGFCVYVLEENRKKHNLRKAVKVRLKFLNYGHSA